MNRKEHLLVIFSEECSEIAQEVAKSLRFGLQDYDPNNPAETNLERIEKEFNQLIAVRDMLTHEGIVIKKDLDVQEQKKASVEKYLRHSIACGTLDN